MDPEETDSSNLSCECPGNENSLSRSISQNNRDNFALHLEGQQSSLSSCVPLVAEQSSQPQVAERCNLYEKDSTICTSPSVDISKDKKSCSSPHVITVQRRASASHIPVLSKSDVAVQYRRSKKMTRSVSVDYSEQTSSVIQGIGRSYSGSSLSHCRNDLTPGLFVGSIPCYNYSSISYEDILCDVTLHK